MKKVVVTGAEEVINALQDGKILYLDIVEEVDSYKYWLYKGFICRSRSKGNVEAINVPMPTLPEYEYYYYDNNGDMKWYIIAVLLMVSF